MIPVPPRILVCREPVDLRKGIAGLAAVCEVQLREAPLDGTLFVFFGRRKHGVKMLVWTHGGFMLVYKRLEKGRFHRPSMSSDRVTISPAELAALLEGFDLSQSRRLPRWNPRIASSQIAETG